MKQKRINLQGRLVFKRWSRKSYAVFNSLHKTVSIGVLITAYSLVQASSAFAQVDTVSRNNEPEQLDEVVIELEPIPEAYSEIARVVQVITQKEINHLAVDNVHQLLDYAANIDVRTRNSGVQSDINVKGGTFDQTLILINGIPVNDPQSGHHNLNLPFDINDVEKVEILQGPGSKIFGPNAYSGVVNFILKKPVKNNFNLYAKASDFNTKKLNASANVNINKFNQFVSVTKTMSDGYMYNTNFDTKKIFLQSRYDINNNSKINLMLSWGDKDFGANSFYHWASLEQKERIRTFISGLNYTCGNKIKLNTNIYWRKNFDTYYWKPEYTPNLTQTNVYGIDLKTRVISFAGKTDIGVSAKYENMFSNKMGDKLDDSLTVPFETDMYYFYGKSRQNINAFLNQSGSISNLYYSLGANFNYNTMFNNNFAYGLELAYDLENGIRPYMSVNSAYRLPTFFDLYYKSPGTLGDTALKPETSVNYEFGLKYNKSIISGNASMFYNS